jgi:hypothetical protein
MGKKKRSSAASEMSIKDLQSALLTNLKSQRNDLEGTLDQLDRQIEAIEGVGGPVTARRLPGRPPGRPTSRKTAQGGESGESGQGETGGATKKGKRGKRPKNTASAKALAMQILGEERNGLSLDDLTDRVLAAGYKSKSTNFKQTLYQALYNARAHGEGVTRDEDTGNWKLTK